MPDINWNQPATEEHKANKVVATLCAGVRLCPNTICQAPVFVIMMDREVLKVYSTIPEDVTVQDIVGHQRHTMTGSVYSGKSTLAMRRDALAKLVYPNA